jgi:hypothetical protein
MALAEANPPAVRAELGPRGNVVLTTSWGKKGSARLSAGTAKSAVLFQGEAAGAIAVGHDRVVVALGVDDAQEPFRIHVLAQAGSPGRGGEAPLKDAAGPAQKVARPGKRHDFPFAVAATATPDGFTIFFQEVQGDDPSAAHTYMVKLDEAGKVAGAAVEVAVPWSLGAAVWDGSGYHLALFYGGDQRGVRLSMVSLSAAGQPQQHPDWASAPGFIDDIHLVAEDGKVRAFYRGGAGGDRLLESDVTKIGNWGGEPAKAKDHGALGKKLIVVGKDGPKMIDRPTR